MSSGRRISYLRQRITTELRLRGLRPLRRNRRRRSWHVWEEEVVAKREPVDAAAAPVRNSMNVRRKRDEVAGVRIE